MPGPQGDRNVLIALVPRNRNRAANRDKKAREGTARKDGALTTGTTTKNINSLELTVAAGQGQDTAFSRAVTWSGPMGTMPVGFSALIE